MSKTKKILLLIAVVYFFVTPVLLRAQEKVADPEILLQVKIPLISQLCNDQVKYKDRYCVSDFGQYIGNFYKYFSGVVGILAAAMIVFGGLQWVTAAGNASKIQNAKTTITGALIGLVLTLGAYVLLNTINPELVSLRFPYLSTVTRQVLGTNFCKDLPGESGMPVIPGSQNMPCGQATIIAKYTTKVFTQKYCCGSFCKQDNKDDPQVCLVAQDSTIESECPETCVSASSACKSADQNNCVSVDSGLAAANSDYACRKQYLTVRYDKCVFTPLVKNPCDINNGLSRADCNYGGLTGDKNTPCWNNNEPRSYLNQGNTKKCTSGERLGKDTDSWCCAYSNKNKINCKLKTENCHDNDVQVACSTYNSQTGNYEDGTTQCDDSLGGLYKCCMQLELQHKVSI